MRNSKISRFLQLVDAIANTRTGYTITFSSILYLWSILIVIIQYKNIDLYYTIILFYIII